MTDHLGGSALPSQAVLSDEVERADQTLNLVSAELASFKAGLDLQAVNVQVRAQTKRRRDASVGAPSAPPSRARWRWARGGFEPAWWLCECRPSAHARRPSSCGVRARGRAHN
jgi:hypothetical protein